MDNTIDRKDYNEAEFKKLLVNFLKTKPQGATQLDMVVGTGLSKDWVDLAVRSLLDDYPAHLETNEKHELVYVFDFESREEQLTPKMMLQKAFKLAWKGFTFFFKVWIVLMLFTYLLFYVLVLAFAVAIITRNGDILGEVLGKILKALRDVFSMLMKGREGDILSDDGYIHQVFSYVFGATRQKTDDLKLEKQLLRFISQNQGKIVVAEIVKLTGWSVRQAQEEAAQLLANYHGDATVTEEGVIVYTFADFDPTVLGTNDEQEVKNPLIASTPHQAVLPIWKRPIPHRPMNDNDKETNNNIMYVNAFNWIMSLVAPFLILFLVSDGENIDTLPDVFYVWTTMIPFAFSFLFWLIPFMRRQAMKSENRRIDAQNEENQLLRVIFNQVDQKIYRDKEVKQLQTALVPVGKQPVHSNLGKLLDKKAIELDAESRSDEKGMYYDFEQLNTDLKVAERLRTR
ncbi:hypothetical protein [Microscilla marina]|uniref:Uncharacterized protein n=1 Tax=Microscilla marina ATCC 23134 TaxID=313606 RepID=A1ZDC0_MICM2|nr:hypothetical protein [Microscilla marina]EAY31659.1 hypothetical protein M23134_05165 [Microscilla marina ATCC 23134]